jgi:hypothetical protein
MSVDAHIPEAAFAAGHGKPPTASALLSASCVSGQLLPASAISFRFGRSQCGAADVSRPVVVIIAIVVVSIVDYDNDNKNDLKPSRNLRTVSLARSIHDAAFREVVRGQLDSDLVPRKDADIVLAHLAGDMSRDGVTVLQLDPENSVRQGLRDRAFHLDNVVF